METDEKVPVGSWLKSRTAWVLLGFLAIMGFFLITEHGAHLFGVLPFLLLLLCPLLHFFLHRGHGENHGDHQHSHGGDKK